MKVNGMMQSVQKSNNKIKDMEHYADMQQLMKKKIHKSN